MPELHDVARSVTTTLFAGERAIDAAVSELSLLPSIITSARTDARLPFGSSQGPLSDAAEALTLLVRARHHVARAHERLREVGVQAGMESALVGDIFECPPENAPHGQGDATPVRLVA